MAKDVFVGGTSYFNSYPEQRLSLCSFMTRLDLWACKKLIML